MLRAYLLLLPLFFALATPGQAQRRPLNRIEISLKDGSFLTGRKLAELDGFLIIETESVGTLRIDLDRIVSITENKTNLGYRPSVSDYRLWGTPTAHNMKKGEVVYRNYMIFLHGVDIGIVDHFSLGLGTELISIFSFEPTFPSILALPKFTYPVAQDRIQVGLAAALINEPFSTSLVDIVMPMALVTVGSTATHFSFGAGQAFPGDRFSNPPPVAFIGGKWQFDPQYAFVSDNWVFSDGSGALTTFGVRRTGRRIHWDFILIGALSPDNSPAFIPLPFIGLAAPF